MAGSGKPVAVILRPGKTPNGAEVAFVLRHVVQAIPSHWPAVDILLRGDCHYARPEAMSWLERNRVGYVFGLAGNRMLLATIRQLAEDAAVARVEGASYRLRAHADLMPIHARTLAAINPPPPPRRRGRPPKNGAATHWHPVARRAPPSGKF